MNLVNEGVLPPDELDDRDERREEQERARSRETVADIVAEMRDAAMNGEYDDATVNDWADRVEIAARRERDHAVEHATRHAEAVARDNCRDCVHNPRGKNYEGGNAAAMREALEAYLALWNNGTMNDLDKLRRVVGNMRAALSAPLRNCDIGTPEEQSRRFDAYCRRRKCECLKCPCNVLPRCCLVWAQMPYKAEEERPMQHENPFETQMIEVTKANEGDAK
jgi:hypothetical protein